MNRVGLILRTAGIRLLFAILLVLNLEATQVNAAGKSVSADASTFDFTLSIFANDKGARTGRFSDSITNLKTDQVRPIIITVPTSDANFSDAIFSSDGIIT